MSSPRHGPLISGPSSSVFVNGSGSPKLAARNATEYTGDVEQANLCDDAPYVSNGSHVRSGHVEGNANTSGDLPPSTSDGRGDADTSPELLSAWMDRLQTLTVVTTFFATVDSQMFTLTTIPTNLSENAPEGQRYLVYSCFSGALIFHVCAAITAYIASFALIRYRIVDASPEEVCRQGIPVQEPAFWKAENLRPAQKIILVEPVRPFDIIGALFKLSSRSRGIGTKSHSPHPPLSLLKRCYYTTLCLTALGFILILTGILSYAWAGLSAHVGGFSTVCLGVGVGAGIWAIAL